MGVLASLFNGQAILPFNDSVTQLVEYHTFNVGVEGSSPSTRTTIWPCGGIGRHWGLKIPWGQPRVGSSPTLATNTISGM